MTSRIVSVCALAVGLALVLTLGLSFGARGTEMESADQALLPGERVTKPSRIARFAPRVGHTSEVTFTPVATLHLPIVFDDWNRCGVSPTLIAPFSNLYTLAPLFRWDGGDNPYATKLRLRISKDPDFDNWVKGLTDPSPQGEHSFRFLDNFEPDTTYYWRAWLVCDEEQGPYSEVLSFRTGANGTLPPTPALRAPEDGTTTPGRSVTLDWESVTRTKTFDYLVRYREVGADRYAWAWTYDTEITRDLSGATPYEWWVAARNDYGIGPDSEIWQFTTPAGSSVAAQDAQHRFRGEAEEDVVIETP